MWWFSRIRASMVVVDGLAPIWHQDICNHLIYCSRSAYIRSAQGHGHHFQKHESIKLTQMLIIELI